MATVANITEREQWLAKRRLGIGSSDAAALFPERSKYGCTRELIFDKRGTPPDFERPEYEQLVLRRGNKLESLVAEEFSEQYGFKVRRKAMIVDREDPSRRVSLDYQVVKATTDRITGVWPELNGHIEGDCGPGVLECKTTNVFDYQRMLKEGIIPDYVFQMQRHLDVSGYKWGVFALLEPDWWKLLAFPMTPNAVIIQEMNLRATAAWDTVQDTTLPLPPALPSGDARCYSCLWRKTCRGIQYLDEYAPIKSKEYTEDDSFSEQLSDLKKVRTEKAALEELETTIAASIQERMKAEGKTKISVPSVGATVRWQEQQGASSWDGRALDAADGQLGRWADFGEWAMENRPDVVLEFQKEKPSSPLLSANYKFRKAPTRPFVVEFDDKDTRQ
jgi:hypothetical protein